ncbi:fumarylacetoacetate hydrolase family protein [Candidatus Latescibacterota bacterium]
MRIYSLTHEFHDFLGFEDDGIMIDLTKAIAFYETVRGNYIEDPPVDIEELIWDERLTGDYIGRVIEYTEKYGFRKDLSVVERYTVNAPLYPGKIIALGNNYHEHIKEMNQQIPEKPVLFTKLPSTVIGHNEPILKPSWIGRMDYEAELAFIVGKRAKNVRASDAMNCVAGYTCLNDISARDIQMKDIERKLPWLQSKNFDTFTPLGPCVLLAGVVKEPVAIDVKSTVNGKDRQSGNTSDFIFDIPATIEYITNIMTLEPGDVVTTGTPSGVGALEPGDVVEITCSGIGILSNPVAAAEA